MASINKIITEEKVEKDTAEDEDIEDIIDFIAPKEILASTTSFGMHYNVSALNGWVKQPSPCCGAASLAGAFNGLLQISRADTRAFHHTDVLFIYRCMFYQLIDSKVKSFERKLGGSFHPILKDIEMELAKDGKYIGGKKDVNGSKEDVRKAIRRILLNKNTNNNNHSTSTNSRINDKDDNSNNLQLDSWQLLIQVEEQRQQQEQKKDIDRGEVKTSVNNKEDSTRNGVITISSMTKSFETSYRIEEDENDGELLQTSSKEHTLLKNRSVKEGYNSQQSTVLQDDDSKLLVGGENNGDDDDGGDEELSDGDNDEEDTAAASSKKKSGGGGRSGTKQWDWVGDILKILKNISGYRKLSDKKVPSTAAIGNQGIMEGTKLLTEAVDINPLIDAQLFLGGKRGTKSKLAIAVSHTDDDKTVKVQWDTLRAAFTDAQTILLFHLKNHYALIFAIREYILREDGRIVRQVLTARRGQRPSVWIDYEEVRDIVLSWEGYKIMRLTLSEAAKRSDLQNCRSNLQMLAEHEGLQSNSYLAA